MPKPVRIFVSSTFRDMHAERDYLVKVVFPELRQRCRERDLELVDVDLRWGVTEDQSALDICLDEIIKCQPFFIGILGERYGWIPPTYNQIDLGLNPWLKEYPGKSITDLEIIHGVLRTPEMRGRGFFYFRDPAFMKDVPPDRKKDFEGESKESEEKLIKLKNEIRASHNTIHENYPCTWDENTISPEDGSKGRVSDLDAFGNRVLEELWAAIEKEHPAGADEEDPLTKERSLHESFASELTVIHIGREEEKQDITRRIKGDDYRPIVVTGDPGCGKSAFMAAWVKSYNVVYPGDFIFSHYIGASPASTDANNLLLRMCEELKQAANVQEKIPEDHKELGNYFIRTSMKARSTFNRIVIAIDALNQLDERDSAQWLGWLPRGLPEHVRLVTSSLAGDPIKAMEDRNARFITLSPLKRTDLEEITVQYLATYRRKLSTDNLALLLENPATENPLYLRTALTELRLFGGHDPKKQEEDPLRKRIKALPSSIEELFDQILTRLETEEYTKEFSAIALTYLACSRYGLTEAELLQLLQRQDEEQFPRAIWARLYRQIEPYLLSRGELLDFFHRQLWKAIHQRYASGPEEKKLIHLKLAYFFAGVSLQRQFVELPHQMVKAQEWEALYTLLSDVKFLHVAWRINILEAKEYWQAVETNSSYRIVDAYKKVLASPGDYKTYVSNVAVLLQTTGHMEEAYILQNYQIELYRESGDTYELQVSLNNQGNILHTRGDLAGAMAMFKESEGICRELGNKNSLLRSLLNQGNIHYTRGNLDGAMALYKEAEHICRKLGNKNDLHASLLNQGNILHTQGNLDGAMAMFKEQERLCRELGKKDDLPGSLCNQGNILHTRGNLDGAMALYKEAERICRELGNKTYLEKSLGNQGIILCRRSDLDGAMALFKEQEQISRELGHKDGLQINLGNQGIILCERGDLDGAMALYKEQEQICREMGNKNGLQMTLGNQGIILKDQGNLNSAMAMFKEQEQICREMGNKNDLQISLGNQGSLCSRSDLDGAMALYKEQEQICRELGNEDVLQINLGNQGIILKDLGDLEGAMALYKEQEQICRELGNKNALQISLLKQGIILHNRGNLDGAMALYKEAERICRELGNKDGLQTSLGNQGTILCKRNDLDGAMPLYKEQEQICRELGNKDVLQINLDNQLIMLNNQGTILHERGDLDGAMAMFKEREQICREVENKDGLQGSLCNQGVIHKDQGNLDGAMALYKEAERICRELGNKNDLQISLDNQEIILSELGHLDSAMALCKEQEQICRELGNKGGLRRNLTKQGAILLKRGDLDGAMPLYKEQEQICRELGNKDFLQNALGNQGTILLERGDLDGAMPLYKEQEQICRELGNKDFLQNALGNQGTILCRRNDLNSAMTMFKEQEQICREMGNVGAIGEILANQGLILSRQGKHNEALALAEEAVELLREANPAMVEKEQMVLYYIRMRRNNIIFRIFDNILKKFFIVLVKLRIVNISKIVNKLRIIVNKLRIL